MAFSAYHIWLRGNEYDLLVAVIGRGGQPRRARRGRGCRRARLEPRRRRAPAAAVVVLPPKSDCQIETAKKSEHSQTDTYRHTAALSNLPHACR